MLALVGLLALVGCTVVTPEDDSSPQGSPASSNPDPGTSTPEPAVVVDGLDVPWSVAFYDGVALVSERDAARVLEIDDEGVAREVGVVAAVTPRGEGGLLGIAVLESHLYAYATTSEGNRVDRYPLTGGAGSLELGPAEPVISGIPAGQIHNGGRLAFGPDGMLYITAGDAGEPANAQDRESLAGKILRLAPDGGIPADNPYPGSPVYSYGHRNPQGIAWAMDGTMYASEFGQNTWDELNIIEPGGNFGWPEVEGIAGQDGFVDPVQQWAPEEASPSGIAVLEDKLYVANLRGERLRVVALDDPGSSVELFVGEDGRLRDLVVTRDGELWVVTNNTYGRGDPEPEDVRILLVRPS